MEIVLQNYGPYPAHVEKTCADRLCKYMETCYIPNVYWFYLDILALLHWLSLAFQQDVHDHVKAIRRIHEFTWTMVKLQMLTDESFDKPESILTQFNKLLGNIEQKQDQDAKKIYTYQSIKLADFKVPKDRTKVAYSESISKVTLCMEACFQDINELLLFENFISLLDTVTQPKIIGDFGDAAVTNIVSVFKELLLRNNCQFENILPEWTVLKSYMMPIIKNNLKAKYLDIWKIIFNDDNIIKECRNSLDIFEIMLICPFSNAKLERMFSRMNHVKKWALKNKTTSEHLQHFLAVLLEMSVLLFCLLHHN